MTITIILIIVILTTIGAIETIGDVVRGEVNGAGFEVVVGEDTPGGIIPHIFSIPSLNSIVIVLRIVLEEIAVGVVGGNWECGWGDDMGTKDGLGGGAEIIPMIKGNSMLTITPNQHVIIYQWVAIGVVQWMVNWLGFGRAHVEVELIN